MKSAQNGPTSHPLSGEAYSQPRGGTPASPSASSRATGGADRPESNAQSPGRPRAASSSVGTGSSSGRSRQQRQTTVTFPRGNVIFTPGTGDGFIYIVRTGCVRLFKTLPDRRTINLALLGPNTIFTQEDGTDGIASGATAEALIDSTLVIVEADDLADLIASSPELATAVIAGMTRRLTDLQTLVEHLLVRDTAVRLATTLMTLANRFGRSTADGMTAIALPLTHQSLANMIGSNRVTVTRKLLELQEQGMVRSLGRNALAVSPDRLRTFAHSPGNDGD